MHKYSVCLIGCGDIGFLFDHKRKIKGALTHFKAFNDSKNFELVAIAEKKSSIRKLLNKKYGVCVYTDYRKMCRELGPDVVSIATNDESHYEILNYLPEFSPGLVFCEKPLALKYEEVKNVADLYEKRNIPLQVNYTRRFLNEFDDIKKMFEERTLGEIESITFYYSRGLIHNASHYLDLVNWYIEKTEKNLINVSKKKGIGEDDDTYSFDLIYDSGLEVRFIGLNPSKLSFAEIDIIGTRGRVKVNYANEMEKYKVSEHKMFKGYKAYEKTEAKPIRFNYALPNAVDNIYKVLSGKERLKSPASNSIKVFELINRIKHNTVCQN